MSRLAGALAAALAAAAPAAAAPPAAWAGTCADAPCSRQGTVDGPASIASAPLWVSTTSSAARSVVRATAAAFSSTGDLLVSADASCTLAGVCFATTTLAGATGAQSLAELYASVGFPTTYQFGVPAVLTPGPAGVVVSGRGWRFDNGSYAGALLGADASTGVLLWSTVAPGGLFGDLATPTSADGSSLGEGLVYALWSEGNTLLALNATTGARVSALAMGAPGHGPRGPPEVLDRKLTLAANGSALCVLDSAGGVGAASATGVDLALGKPAVSWAVAGFVPPTLSTGVAKLAADAATSALLLANGSGLSSLRDDSGAAAWTSPFPDAIADSDRLGLAVDRAPDGAAFVFASQAPPGSGSSGAPVLYAFSKATGALLARTDFNSTQDYIKWGDSLVLGASGGALYVSLLGPNVAPPPAQGGTVYLARVPFSGDAFGDAEIAALPPALQAGQPLLALGPAAGQLTVAVADAVGVIDR